MKKAGILTASLLVLTLTSCASWVTGSKPLADKSASDSQINAKIVDGKSTMAEVDSLFGERTTGRAVTTKTFPDGKYPIAVYTGHLNGFGGTYGHRKLYVVYDSDNKVINHDIATNEFTKQNRFEKDYLNARNVAFSDIDRGDNKEKVISLLGTVRDITFSDNGDLIWMYAKTEISRDASSYVPIYNAVKGTESGTSERLYIEFDRSGKVSNVMSASVTVTQGLGFSNVDSYVEKFDKLTKKY